MIVVVYAVTDLHKPKAQRELRTPEYSQELNSQIGLKKQENSVFALVC